MAFGPATQYLKTKVMTASPEMLQLMLWDGAIRFSEQAKEAILKKDIEGSYNALIRAQKIIMEMNVTLKHDVAPDLCDKMSALYTFMYRRLVDANLQKDIKAVDDALQIMRHQRETWVMLIEKLNKEKAAAASSTTVENASAVSVDRLDLAPAANTAPAIRPMTVKPSTLPRYNVVRPAAPVSGLSVEG